MKRVIPYWNFRPLACPEWSGQAFGRPSSKGNRVIPSIQNVAPTPLNLRRFGSDGTVHQLQLARTLSRRFGERCCGSPGILLDLSQVRIYATWSRTSFVSRCKTKRQNRIRQRRNFCYIRRKNFQLYRIRFCLIISSAAEGGWGAEGCVPVRLRPRPVAHP